MRAMLTHNWRLILGLQMDVENCGGCGVRCTGPSIEMSVEVRDYTIEFPPAMIVFKPDRDFKFENFPWTSSERNPHFSEGRLVQYRKEETQNTHHPPKLLTCAYAFTDQKEQGQI